jgi:hypothetical protein
LSRILKEEEDQAEEHANGGDNAKAEEAVAEMESYEEWMAEVANATDDQGQMIVNDSVKDE